jgi:hypothetical protein
MASYYFAQMASEQCDEVGYLLSSAAASAGWPWLIA